MQNNKLGGAKNNNARNINASEKGKGQADKYRNARSKRDAQSTEIFNKSTQSFTKANASRIQKDRLQRENTGSARRMDVRKTVNPKIKNFFTPKITIFAVLLTVFLIFAICIGVNIIVGIKSIEVNGNDLISREEILSVAEISEDSGYFDYSSRKIEEKILKNVPCITDVKVKRSPLGKVRISVTEQKAYFYTYTSNEYFALSKELTVIKKSDEKDAFINRNLVRLDFPQVQSAILGSKIEFSDSGRDCSFADELLQGVIESKMYESKRINQICIEDKFNIYIVADLKYKIFIGKSSQIREKLFSAERALSEEVFADGEKWELDVSNISNITSRRNGELDFSYLMAKKGK